jgi:hypothetical protein
MAKAYFIFPKTITVVIVILLRNYIFQLLQNGYTVHWINNVFDKSIYNPCNKEELLVFNCENKDASQYCLMIQ